MTKTKAPPFLRIKHSNHAPKDAAHVKYIGSRPGVEKVPVHNERDSDAAHIQYAGTRPRNTGLFGPVPDRNPLMTEAMKEVGNRESGPSWRLVLSLREDDARELGIGNLVAWQDLSRRSMAQFAKGIRVEPGRLRWVAAHHPERGHPHVHVIAWLDDATPRRRGLLSSLELREVRRGVAQEIFGPLRTRLAAERTLARNTMLGAVKENVAQAERVLKKIELEAQVAEPLGKRLPPRFGKTDMETLAMRIENLAGKMPGKGQAKLAYMPAEVKEEARAIARWILERPQMVETLVAYENATRKLTGLYSRQQERSDQAWGKGFEDIRDRVAQVVVRASARQDRTLDMRELKAQRVFRSAFAALENERLRAEAKSELASLQEAERAETRVRRELETEMGGSGRL
ncbi:MAG: MobP3 family relaxase [Bacillota bacterium]